MTEQQGLREAKKAQTRAAISRAALGLAAERGYQAVTVADIAAAAGVSRRTISNYFPSKADCFTQLDDEYFITHLAAEVTKPDVGGTRERLAAAFKDLPEQFWNDCALVYQLERTEPEVGAVIARSQRETCNRIAEDIVEVSGGAVDRLRIGAAILAIAGCMNAAMGHWLNTGSKGGIPALAGYAAESITILDLGWLDPYLGLLNEAYNARPAH